MWHYTAVLCYIHSNAMCISLLINHKTKSIGCQNKLENEQIFQGKEKKIFRREEKREI